MTNDFSRPWETKSLIKSSQGTFYPVRIPQQHHQLKNFISTRDPSVIYYASEFDVFALNTTTQKQTLVKSLPFKPVCLDAGYGWICTGGANDGQCAFISIDEHEIGETALGRHVEVDDLLPLGLDPEPRRSLHEFRRTTPRWALYPGENAAKYELQAHELGGDIVNSVTICLMRSEQKGFKEEVVVVMTNNDKTVRIFSLTLSRLLTTLDFSTAMNHASISPDGNLLLAVGDEGRAFFCRRVRLPSARIDGDSSYSRYEWHQIAEPELRLSGHQQEAWCFTTAFSPSGHICAVASQSGIVTIFDTALIREDMDFGEAVIDVLKSSRQAVASTRYGAVRSMSFSPAPWDLLAWAEDRGRVCVVDLRNGLCFKQVIALETDSPDLNRVEIEDHNTTSEQRQLEIERRFLERHREALEAQEHLAAVSHTADYLEFAAERRRLEREVDATSRDLHALTERERQLVDSIGLRRPQGSNNDSSTSSPTGPTSVNYTPSRNTEAQSWTGLPSPTPSSNIQSRSTASINEFMRLRNWERARQSDRAYQPRRRSSVVITSSSNASSPHPSSSLAPIGTATPTLSASPSRLPSSSADLTVPHLLDSDPWQTITDAMGGSSMTPDTMARLRSLQARNLERNNQTRPASQSPIYRPTQALQGAREQTMVGIADAVEARVNRAREANLRNLRQARVSRGADVMHDEIDREVLFRRRERGEVGVTTMGIGWSAEGRYLYVATEDGILEYPVNMENRKAIPSISFL